MEATPPCLEELLLSLPLHTKYIHLQRLHYSCLKGYIRNQYLLLNSSAIITVYNIKRLALFIPMHDFWPPLYMPKISFNGSLAVDSPLQTLPVDFSSNL